MNICVTGSIATDHLMTFRGRFADSLIADQLANLSVSFLVDDLQIRRGGVGGNIAFGLGSLGLSPILAGAVGDDFADYRAWLVRHGVDVSSVHQTDQHHTARFVCTTDEDSNQIASFYPGAMSTAREIELAPIAARVGGIDIVVISPNDPEAMARHTAECREARIPYVADPSQQLAFMGAAAIRDLVDGASYLFTNEYESGLIEQKTGWSAEAIAQRVATRITTRGGKGSVVASQDSPLIEVAAAAISRVVDPTGVGDGFRAGYLAGLGWGLSAQRCAEIGSVMAAYVIETTGPQEYEIRRDEFLARLAQNYGDDSAADVVPHLHIAS